MARVAVFGLGPMRWEQSTRLFALPLRTWHFARTLAESGHAVALFSMRLDAYEGWPSDKVTRIERDGVMVHSLSEHAFHERPDLVERRLAEFRPTCVVGVNTYPASIAVNFAGDLPFWADVNGDPMAEAQSKSGLFGGDRAVVDWHGRLVPILGRADRISTCSERQRMAVIGQLGVLGRLTGKNDGYEFVDAIPNSIDDEELRSLAAPEMPERIDRRRRRGPTDPFVVLASGGYNTWADIETLATALEQAMEADARVRFVSLGGGIRGHDEPTYASFEKRVATSRFRDRFELRGWVLSEELPAYYRSADAAILVDAFTYEGLLGARTRVLDWLAAGLPIVMTRLSEISLELDRRGAARTTRCGDAGAIADALVALARDPDEARAMGERGRAYAARHLRAGVQLRPLVEWVGSACRAPDRERRVALAWEAGRWGQARKLVALFGEQARAEGVGRAIRRTASFAARKVTSRAQRWMAPLAGSVEPAPAPVPRVAVRPPAQTPEKSPLEWRERIEATEGAPRVGLLLSVTANAHDDAVSWTIEHVRRQYYPHWRLLVAVAGDAPAALRKRALAEVERAAAEGLAVETLEPPAADRVPPFDHRSFAESDYFGVLGPGDLLRVDALAELCEAARTTNADMVYADEAEIDETNVPHRPFVKPGWSPDFLLSFPYVGQPVLYRAALARNCQDLRAASSPRALEYELALHVSEASSRIEHVPLTLCTRWTPTGTPDTVEERVRAFQERTRLEHECVVRAVWRRGLDAVAERGLRPGSFRVRYRSPAGAKVSIVVPTRDRLDLLERCLGSLETRTTFQQREVIVVDNGSVEEATLRYLRACPYRVLRYDEPFNFSRLNNKAAREASGDYLVLLNNDTEVISPDWLDALLEHAQRREVGAVGAKLLSADGTVAHAGICYGRDRVTYAQRFVLEAGHEPMTEVVGNYSAVTAACLMMRRDLYLEVGGLDEAFAVAYNDVDLCLRLRKLGYLVVYTPYAALYHDEGSNRGVGRQPATDDALLHSRWLSQLGPDPYLGALAHAHAPPPP